MDELSDILFIYLIVVLVWLVIASFTLISIARQPKMNVLLKIFWCAIIITAPVLGLVIYLAYKHNRQEST
jgi:hypothetical protein